LQDDALVVLPSSRCAASQVSPLSVILGAQGKQHKTIAYSTTSTISCCPGCPGLCRRCPCAIPTSGNRVPAHPKEELVRCRQRKHPNRSASASATSFRAVFSCGHRTPEHCPGTAGYALKHRHRHLPARGQESSLSPAARLVLFAEEAWVVHARAVGRRVKRVLHLGWVEEGRIDGQHAVGREIRFAAEAVA
jgi:hypothetical protein